MENSITERILRAAEDLGVNNNQLAITLGVHRTNISEWKTGKSSPSPKLILKFIFHYDIDANWLIRGKAINTAQNISNTGTKNAINVGGTQNINSQQMEIKYLKEIIAEKEEQIKLLKSVLEHR